MALPWKQVSEGRTSSKWCGWSQIIQVYQLYPTPAFWSGLPRWTLCPSGLHTRIQCYSVQKWAQLPSQRVQDEENWERMEGRALLEVP